ncbi:hypothetical protein SPRG_16928, partial [Saprolegnia parasitica CBS 223.65]
MHLPSPDQMALLFTQAEAGFIVRTFCGRPDANAVYSSAKHKQVPPHSPNGVDDPLDALLFCDLPLDHSPTNEIPHVCLAPDCHQRTQATRGYCRQHGATKRCEFAGCPRGPQKAAFASPTAAAVAARWTAVLRLFRPPVSASLTAATCTAAPTAVTRARKA